MMNSSGGDNNAITLAPKTGYAADVSTASEGDTQAAAHKSGLTTSRRPSMPVCGCEGCDGGQGGQGGEGVGARQPLETTT
jgi:hypothetical protein